MNAADYVTVTYRGYLVKRYADGTFGIWDGCALLGDGYPTKEDARDRIDTIIYREGLCQNFKFNK